MARNNWIRFGFVTAVLGSLLAALFWTDWGFTPSNFPTRTSVLPEANSASEFFRPEQNALPYIGLRETEEQGEWNTFGGYVMVQRVPGGPFTPLEHGLIRAHSGGAEFDLPVVVGKWSAPSSLSSSGSLDIRAIERDGEPLGFLPTTIALDKRRSELNVFEYEGFFLIDVTPGREEYERLTVYGGGLSQGTPSELKLEHPGNLQLIEKVENTGTTPMYLPTLSAPGPSYWVTAPGRCWQVVSATQTNAKSVMVELPRGATLRVGIRDFQRARDLRVHGFAGREHIVTFANVTTDWFTLEGLPVGMDSIVLSFGGPRDAGSVVSRVKGIELRENEPVDVEISMPRLPQKADLGAIAGVFSLDEPDLWKDTLALRGLALVLEQDPPTIGYMALSRHQTYVPIASLEKVLEAEWRHTWLLRIDDIPAGNYRLRLNSLDWEIDVSVPPGGEAAVNLIVPPVARVVVEAWRGEHLVKNGRVAVLGARYTQGVNSLDAGRLQMGALVSPTTADQDGLHTIITMPGDVSISYFPPMLQRIDYQFVAEAGWNNERIQVADSLIIELQASDSVGCPLGIPFWDKAIVKHVGDRGADVGKKLRFRGPYSADGTPYATIFVSEPGEYVVSFVDLPDGYQIESQTFTARSPKANTIPHNLIVLRR